MALIVQKFGGTSVANTERIFNVADIVTRTAAAGNQVVVVVSAQGDTTDDFIEKAAEITDKPPAREMDVLLSAGEQISMALLAMAIEKLGYHATSLTGWQAGIETSLEYGAARIHRVKPERIRSLLDRHRIVVVAGFQGVNSHQSITTLGRGYDSGCHCGGAGRRFVSDLYRCRRCIYRRSACGTQCAQAGGNHV